MTLNLHHVPQPYSATDAMRMLRAITEAMGQANAQRQVSGKTMTFLDELHRRGFTIVPAPELEASGPAQQSLFHDADPPEGEQADTGEC